MAMGKLDEISLAIGGLQEGMRNLQQDIAEIKEHQDERDGLQDKRHEQNQRGISDLKTLIENGPAGPAALSVKQKVALATIGVGVLSALVWVIEQLFGVVLGHIVMKIWK